MLEIVLEIVLVQEIVDCFERTIFNVAEIFLS